MRISNSILKWSSQKFTSTYCCDRDVPHALSIFPCYCIHGMVVFQTHCPKSASSDEIPRARQPHPPTRPLQHLTLHNHLPSKHTHTLTMPPQQHLIDVRSPAEFSTGPLKSDIAPTINIEYQRISQLASIYAALGTTVHKDDHITLYCRSGRRSGIALQTLREMGFGHVRDIGGLEEARRVLDREMVERQIEGEIGVDGGGVEKGEKGVGEGKGGDGDAGKKEERERELKKLLEGLKALEE